jgi:Tfp pilus assembly protein PilO
MRRARGLFTGELVIAVILLAAVLGVDFLWVRPQNNELHSLVERKRAAEEALWRADESRDRERAVLEYMEAADTAGGAEAYRGQNPLTLLEDLRQGARLRSLDVSLDKREVTPPLERTTYFMSVYGSFERQIRFLKALESARPLVTVDALTMDTREGDPEVTLKVNVTVLTPAEGEGP